MSKRWVHGANWSEGRFCNRDRRNHRHERFYERIICPQSRFLLKIDPEDCKTCRLGLPHGRKKGSRDRKPRVRRWGKRPAVLE